MFAADVWTFLCHKLFQIDHISRAIERNQTERKHSTRIKGKSTSFLSLFFLFPAIILQDYCYFSCFSFYCFSIDSKKITDTTHTHTNTVGEVGRLVSLLEEKEHRTEYRLPITKQIQNTNTNTKTRFPTVSSFDSTFNDKRARCTISFPTHTHKHDLHLFSFYIFSSYFICCCCFRY